MEREEVILYNSIIRLLNPYRIHPAGYKLGRSAGLYILDIRK